MAGIKQSSGIEIILAMITHAIFTVPFQVLHRFEHEF